MNDWVKALPPSAKKLLDRMIEDMRAADDEFWVAR